MLGVGAAAGVGRDDDEVPACAAPGVRCRCHVQVDVVVCGEAARGFACCCQAGNGLVQVAVCVEVGAPEILAVGWVGAACEALLGAVVEDGDSPG